MSAADEAESNLADGRLTSLLTSGVMNEDQLATFIGSIKTHLDQMASHLDQLRAANANNETAIWQNLCEILAPENEGNRAEFRRRLAQAQQEGRRGLQFGKVVLGIPL